MKKRKKGFTLIELLAVIVILAVIALIAVPLILSLVNKSRLKAAEESALFYVDTIENMLMINNIENTDGKTYKVKGKTVVDENNEVILNLEIKGDTPYNGVNNEIKINNGFVETANLRFNSYYVHYEMNMETKEFKTCISQKGFLDKCDGTGEIKPSTPEEPTIALSDIKLGDYVSYIPSSTSYTIAKGDTGYSEDQVINPSDLKVWRVIRKNADGTVDLVSEYVPTNIISFTGRTGYYNYIGTLNKIAKAYEDVNYTIGSRHMGYDSTKADEYVTSYDAGDEGYLTDVDLVTKAIGRLGAQRVGIPIYVTYWLASRTLNASSSLQSVQRDTIYSNSLGDNGTTGTLIRPIVVLKSNLRITGGDGTSDSPYQLKVSTPSEIESGATIEIAKDKTYLAEVYLDPTDISKKCTKEDALANINEYGTPTMITSGCMKWYVYKDDGKNYTMILDHNTTIGVRWDQEVGTTELDKRFSNDVKNWEDTLKETARFISADEIAEITGASREDTIRWHSSKKFSTSLEINMDTEASYFYLDGSGSTYNGWRQEIATTPGSSKYAWLYDYMESCTGGSSEYGCNVADNHLYIEADNSSNSCSIYKWNGCRKVLYYWLLNEFNNDLISSYAISRNGAVTYGPSMKLAGIRPVITVPKSMFS